MKQADLKVLIEEGYALDLEIKVRQEKLDAIKARLAQLADGKPLEVEANRCKLSISFAPSMIRTVPADKLAELRKATGTFFDKLFTHAPIAKFKDVATALLGDKAQTVIEALQGPVGPRVSFRPLAV